MKPRLLDLFCGGGGGGMGYYQAGFEVIGVDNQPQKRYPFPFIEADAFEYLAASWHEFDVIHASPPCQEFTTLKALTGKEYPDLIAKTRDALRATGKLYVIENVPRAPLQNALILCGTMFGLRVIRHRAFESNPPIYFPPACCNHWGSVASNSKWKDGKRIAVSFENFDILTVTGHDFIVKDAQIAMGIDWLGQKELSQAIPPAFTKYIGLYLMDILKGES